jgi:hypothetical protein
MYGRLRSLLPDVPIGNGRCGGQPRGRLGTKQQPLQMWVDVTGVKGLLQMLSDLFEVFT